MPDHDQSSRSRRRSRSPYHETKLHHQPRSRSPSRRDYKPPHPAHNARTRPLPYGAHELSRHDLKSYQPLFRLYLDVQKQIDLDDLDEKEIKGRWKSFVGKWNRGEVAEGWYDSKTLEKARASTTSERTTSRRHTKDPVDDGSDNEYGPTLPSSSMSQLDRNSIANSRRPGATIPSLTDLRARDEQSIEDATIAREQYVQDIRYERRADRKQQREKLDELVPRAEAGTRERQLEKKREKADSNRTFAATKDTTGDVDLRDSDVMGDEDSLGELKRMKIEKERKKNDRELRREEILRARQAEREVRLQAVREREEKTMSLFREIARQRFGGVEEEQKDS